MILYASVDAIVQVDGSTLKELISRTRISSCGCLQYLIAARCLQILHSVCSGSAGMSTL